MTKSKREQNREIKGEREGKKGNFSLFNPPHPPTSILFWLSLQLSRNNLIVNACDALYPTYKPWFPRCDSRELKQGRFWATHVNRKWAFFPFSKPLLYHICIECFHSRDQHLCKFIGTKESVCIRKEFNSHRIGLGHHHGRRFIVLGHQYGRHDVMWKHSIAKCLNSYRDDLPKNLFQITAKECKKSISG